MEHQKKKAAHRTTVKAKAVSPARSAAYTVLINVLYKGAFSNVELKNKMVSMGLNEKDRRLCRLIVHGTIQNRRMLERKVALLSNIPFSKIDATVVVILIMALWQLEALSRVPVYSIVNDAVNLAAFYQKGTTGFVNALLRRYVREADRVAQKAHTFQSEQERFYYTYNVNQDVYERLKAQYGTAFLQRYFSLCKKPAPLYVRYNTLKGTRALFEQRLCEEGVAFSRTALKNVYALKPGERLERLELFQEGWFLVMDIASAFVGEVLSAPAGAEVLDVCSAPGSKAMVVGMGMGNEGKILCLDVKEEKLPMIAVQAGRLGISIVKTKKRDGTFYDAGWKEKFSHILCDVPCSGLGVLRRKGEILFDANTERLDCLAGVQKRILDNALCYLKPGGTLVYSTCTINREENEEVVASALQKHRDVKAVPLQKEAENLGGVVCGDGVLLCDLTRSDGFFVAKLTKIE